MSVFDDMRVVRVEHDAEPVVVGLAGLMCLVCRETVAVPIVVQIDDDDDGDPALYTTANTLDLEAHLLTHAHADA